MKTTGFIRTLTAIASLALLSAAAPAARAADDYPSRTINFIVASTPGGILDVIGRIVSRGLERFGQPVAVQNIPGAGGTIGTLAAAKAPADGYTLVMVATSHAINPSVYSKMPYDTLKDFTTLSHAVNLTNMLVVHPSVPAANLREFIELAKRKPGELSCGSAGNGQSNHLSLEMLNTAVGIKLMHIPYKGSAQATNDVMGGSLTCMFVDALTATPLVQAGKLKALVVTSKTRLAALPDVPTFAESGMPDFAASSWLSVAIRSNTPKDIVEKLGRNVNQTFQDPEVRQRLLSMGIEPVGALPEPSTRFMEAEVARYATAVKNAGVKID